MSRYGSQAGVYIPVIRSIPEIEDIVDILSLAAVKNLKKLSETIPFVDMFLAEVSRNGYDNEMFDEVVQLIANMVEAEACENDDHAIEEIAGQVVVGLAATFVANNPRLEKLLTGPEIDVLEDCLAEIANIINQLERPGRQSRGSNRRGGSRGGRGDDRDYRRGNVDRRAYNGGSSRRDDGYNDRGSRYDQSPRGRRKSREPLNYRGNEDNRDNRVSRNGRQPPAAFESYHDAAPQDSRRRDNLTTKDRLRLEEQDNQRGTRDPQTAPGARQANRVSIGGQRTQSNNDGTQARAESRAARLENNAKAVEPVVDNKLSSNEQWYEKKDGSRVIIVPVSIREIKNRKGPYKVLPLFPVNMAGHFTLNSDGDITGVLGIPKSEEDMDRERHDPTRFFTTWGPKTRVPNHKATAKALGHLQTKALINEIEEELESKYNFDELEELPVIDIDKLYVANSITTYEPHEDFVSTGRQILLDEVKHEHVKEMFSEGLETATINYSAIEFCGWTIVGDAAKKAMELKGLSSFSAIKNKLFELDELIPSSTLHELDVIATNWVNDYVQYNLGIKGWIIDSFMSDIDELVTELAREHRITTEFTSKAALLVGTVLCPMTNQDSDIRALTGLSEDGAFTVKFGKMSNITLIQVDSDELAIYLTGLSGVITRESWPTLSMALDVVNTLSKPTTAEMVLITKDNRKIHISQGDTTGSYIVSR